MFLFAVAEQHLFRTLSSLENVVSEPVHLFYTPLDLSLPEISWLVPRGGAVNRYFRGADVEIM